MEGVRPGAVMAAWRVGVRVRTLLRGRVPLTASAASLTEPGAVDLVDLGGELLSWVLGLGAAGEGFLGAGELLEEADALPEELLPLLKGGVVLLELLVVADAGQVAAMEGGFGMAGFVAGVMA